MKKIIVGTFLTTSLLFIVGCSSEKMETGEMMKDQAKQNEVMSIISENADMTSNMISHMLKSETSLELIKSDEQLIHHMMGDQTLDHMIGMMDQDTLFCKKVMDKMMGNERVKMMVMDMAKMKMMEMEKMDNVTRDEKNTMHKKM